MALNQNHSYNLVHQDNPGSSDSSLLIFVIVVPIILATVFILITYFTSSWHQVNPLRWISILRASSQDEDPFIALSPRTWNRGLDESAIQEIPAFQFTKGEGIVEDKSVVCGCVVCLAEFQEQDMLKVLPNCSHAFHLDCIDIWLQTNANCPLCRTSIAGNKHSPTMDHIIAPSSSPQDSQLLSNMGSDEDFVVIELGGGEHEATLPRVQQEVNESREGLEDHSTRKMVQLKPRKCHHVSIMGDECIDVWKKDEQFCSLQPIRRSFSMDSANDRQVYLDVQAIVNQDRHQNEGSASEDCSGRNRRSFFPFRYGRGSKSAVLPLENDV